MKKISILGSTGSIGVQTLDVVRQVGSCQIVGLTANKNIDLLEKQIQEFLPMYVSVGSEQDAEILRNRIKKLGFNTEVIYGMEGIIKVAVLEEIDTVVNALVGNVGLIPTIEAISKKKNIALANKETLVSAGELIMSLVEEHNVNLYPVDSEHSAIFQCLQGNEKRNIDRIYLTASGGPFRGKTTGELMDVTREDALKHPNWSMGEKITIDSATLMNKGLEVIEARWLFNVPINKIQVVIHPQSIIHSMVEFCDSSIIAQLGEADMRIPIQYALTYPNRIPNSFKKLNIFERNNLTFEEPDHITFPCLDLAFWSIKIGGCLPCVLNAANEEAVYAFLAGNVKFLDIPIIIEKTMSAYTVKKEYVLSDILEADLWAREFAKSIIHD